MFNNDQDFSFDFKQFFSPLTTKKAIYIIAVIGFIVYFNCLFNGFVLEDNVLIVHNPADVYFFNIERIFGANNFNQAGQYRPISVLYFAVVYHLFGLTTFFYHIIQVALHITNAVLLYLLLKKFFDNIISFSLALIFLVHPMNVESVSWISGSMSVLLFVFGISALLPSLKDRITFSRLLLISGLLLLSVLSKEPGVFFLFLVPILRILYWKKHSFVFVLSTFAVLLIYLTLRVRAIGFEYTATYLQPIEHLSFLQRVFNIPRIIFFYIGTFLFPHNLAIRHNWTITTLSFQNFILPLFLDIIFFLSILLLGFYVHKQHREQWKIFIFFFLWFAIGLGMIIQIVPLDATVADRWMYFPMAGLLGIIGVGLQTIQIHSSRIKQTAAIATVVIISILSIRTIVRNANWQDSITLYTHDIQVDDDYTKEGDLGMILMDKGMKDQAYQHFEKAVELNPRSKAYLFQYNWVGNHIQR